MTKQFACAVAALALSATALSAQRRVYIEDKAVELGIDGGITIELGDNSFTTISLPTESFRIGFSVGRKTQLEPKALLHVVTGNDETLTAYQFELGLLYSFGSDRYPGAYHRAGMYLRPFGGIVGFSDGISRTNGYLGAGFGMKWPIVSRLSSRFEANLGYRFGDNDAAQIGILGGVSFYTR